MFELIVILICIGLNALLACAEAAFIAVNKQILKGIVDSGSERAKTLMKLRKHPERILSLIQIGITFLAALAAATGGAGAQTSFSPWLADSFSLSLYTSEMIAMLLVVVPLTYVSVVFGELVPKTIALKYPLSIAMHFANFLALTEKILSPIVWIFEKATKYVVSLFHLTRKKGFDESGEPEDLISDQGKEYIVNLYNVETTQVKDVLLDWSSVDKVQKGQSFSEVEEILITTGHTRLPVLDEGEIVGILLSKEFFAYRKTGKSDWNTLIRSPIIFNGKIPILTALKELQEQSAHMGIVKEDEEPVGIITIEDIFEEVVGEIYDEDDYGSLQSILKKSRYR